MDAARYGMQMTVLVYLLSAMRGDVGDALAVIAASAAVGALSLWPRHLFRRYNWERLRGTLRRHWHMSKWLAASALMQWTSGNFFVLAAGAMLGPEIGRAHV